MHSLNIDNIIICGAPTVYSTTECKRFGHRECQLRVSNRSIPKEDIQWFLGFIESYVASGAKLAVGQTLQVGWMLTRFEAGPQGSLRVTEPDMQGIPMNFVDSVDRTLIYLRRQNDVVRSLLPEVEPDFPSMRQSVVAHINYKRATSISLTRRASQGANSGWTITDTADTTGPGESTRFFTTSLYQLGMDRPDLIPFFALPPALEVMIDDLHTSILGPDGEISQIPGSYLQQMNRHKLQGGY